MRIALIGDNKIISLSTFDKIFMNKVILRSFLIAMTLIPLQSGAQELKESGADAKQIVPTGWGLVEATGDLNGDGVNDLALIATPNNKEKMTTRDDGYIYNFNQPVLAIYWGLKGGGFKLFKQYSKVVPAREDEFVSITPSLSITKKGALVIDLEYFVTAGSYTQPTSSHTFRYQNGDFFLIGKEATELERTTGKTVVTSDNYLTGKRCVTTGNISRKKTKAKWSKLPKRPLVPMGETLE